MEAPSSVRSLVPGDPVTQRWLADLADESAEPARLPSRTELLEILEDLAVPGDDIDAVLRLRSRLDERDELRWLLDRAVAQLVNGLGSDGATRPFPTLAGVTDPLLRYFYVFVYAAMCPITREWHAARGVSPEVSRRTLADVGRQLTHNHRRLGYRGLNTNADWLMKHFCGQLYQLGRLQFEIVRLGNTTGREITAGGQPFGPGDPALAVHIPDYCGPFTPAQCQESFNAVRRFFAKHFPEHRAGVLTCHSWLLSRDLVNYLPADSNIVQFARLFTVNHRESPAQDDMFFRFVFGVPSADNLDALPQDTALQRALVQHLRDGKHWTGGVGWRLV
jgi:hypothetical protein